MKKNECFVGFKEKPIEFAPTYKFDINSNNYDTSAKKRVPSWCDRILYKIEKNEQNDFIECNQLSYNSINNYNQSDHKPVFGLFEIKVKLFKSYKINKFLIK
jgi:hypothetical protein